jgi:hypothetical protein
MNKKIQGKISLTPNISGNIKTSKIYPDLEDLEITPSDSEQKFKSSKYGYDNVTVKAAEEKDPTVPQHVKEITEQDIQNWNSVDGLENILRDILEAIQNGETTSMVIEEIEQLIVSYFENKTVEEVEA